LDGSAGEPKTATQMAPLLNVVGLNVEVHAGNRAFKVVRDISLTLEAGETMCIVGESGCGKTMTALALMGLLPSVATRSAARLVFDGHDLATLSPRAMDDLRGNRIGMIFQDPNTALNPSFTIGHQLEEVWLRHRGGGRSTARDRALALLARVGIAAPAERLGQYPHQLSGGLRQRAMIAMALMCGPKLLLADEPTTALDVTVQAQVLRLLRELQHEFNLGLVLITHDIGVVAAMANRVAVMYAGEFVETGAARQILERPLHPYTRGLLACFPRPTEGERRRLGVIPGSVPIPGSQERGCQFAGRCEIAIDACRSASIALAAAGIGHDVRCARWRDTTAKPPPRTLATVATARRDATPAQSGGPMIEISSLTRDFRLRRGLFSRRATLPALRGVSLRLKQNDAIAIVGESGCGKSTLARIALGLLTPSKGDVYLAGRPVESYRRAERARLAQPVFQDPYASLAPHRRVVDTVAAPLQALRVGRPTERRNRAMAMLERVGLSPEFARRLPVELSGGQRQRVAIARALVLEPPVLICDEPTSALDVSVQAQILNLLLDLKDALNLSMLLITHNLAVVEQVADRVAVMYLGRIVEEGPVEAVLRRPRHPYTRLLLASVLDPDRPGGGLDQAEPDGGFPDPLDPPPGCAFHPRCPRRLDVCTTTDPQASPLTSGYVACHHPIPEAAQ
jgi:peptide/nickel transport system ATP-binding protein